MSKGNASSNLVSCAGVMTESGIVLRLRRRGQRWLCRFKSWLAHCTCSIMDRILGCGPRDPSSILGRGIMVLQIIALFLLFISMIIQVIIPPIPAELIVISAGRIYGVSLTTYVAGSGLYLGSILVFIIGKYIHKRYYKFFKKEKIKLTINKIKKYESFILWLRILPYNPSDIISYAAGIIRVKTRKFLVISFFT